MKTTQEIIDKLTLNYHFLNGTKLSMKEEMRLLNGKAKKEMFSSYYIICGQLVATKEMLDFIGDTHV